MDQVTQRILAETYMMSRVRYAAEIFYPHMAKTYKR